MSSTVRPITALSPRRRIRFGCEAVSIDLTLGIVNTVSAITITVVSIAWNVSYRDTYFANLCWLATYARIIGDDSIFENFGVLGEVIMATFNALASVFILQDYYGVWAAPLIPWATSTFSAILTSRVGLVAVDSANKIVQPDSKDVQCSEIQWADRVPGHNFQRDDENFLKRKIAFAAIALSMAMSTIIFGVIIATLWALGYSSTFRLTLWFGAWLICLVTIASINLLQSEIQHRWSYLTMIAFFHFPLMISGNWADLVSGAAVIGSLVTVACLSERERDNLKINGVNEDNGECARAFSKVTRYGLFLLASRYLWIAVIGVTSISVGLSLWRPVSIATYYFAEPLRSTACGFIEFINTNENMISAINSNATIVATMSSQCAGLTSYLTAVTIAIEQKMPVLASTCTGMSQEYLFPYDPVAALGVILLLFPTLWILFSAFPMSRMPLYTMAELEDETSPTEILKSVTSLWDTMFVGAGILLIKIASGPIWLGSALALTTHGTYSNVFTSDGATLLICVAIIVFAIPIVRWLLTRGINQMIEKRSSLSGVVPVSAPSRDQRQMSARTANLVMLRGLTRFLFSPGMLCLLGAVAMLTVADYQSSVDTQVTAQFTPTPNLPGYSSVPSSVAYSPPLSDFCNGNIQNITTITSSFNATTNATTTTITSALTNFSVAALLGGLTYDCGGVLAGRPCNLYDQLVLYNVTVASEIMSFTRANQDYTNPWDKQRWVAITVGISAVFVAILVMIGYMRPGSYISIITLFYYALVIFGAVTEVSLLQLIAVMRNAFPDNLTVTVYIPTSLILASFLAVLAFGFWWQNGMTVIGQRDLLPSEKTRADGMPVYQSVDQSASQVPMALKSALRRPSLSQSRNNVSRTSPSYNERASEATAVDNGF